MSRLHGALCALILMTTPVAVMASNPSAFERPEAFRHAINSVVGDASYLDRYGTAPPLGTDPDIRIRTHLVFVHELLARRDTSTMPAELAAARRENLARLREYIEEGVFPRNERYLDQNRPCFIDDDGRICAVGYLVEQSAGRDIAERINASFQYSFLFEMKLPELDRWIASSGLSLLELAMIQPCYDPEFLVSVTRVGDSTVRIKGLVYDQCECGVKYTMFDFGDALWQSGKTQFGASVDISHTYAYPGAYVIRGYAISRDWCGNELVTATWMVNVGAPVMRIEAVEVPGGPPYGVYLTTTEDLSMNCGTPPVVQWQTNGALVPANWYLENGRYRTPVHNYTTAGNRTITIANTYVGNCTANMAASLTVSVNGVVTSIDDTPNALTWGAIKAMYR